MPHRSYASTANYRFGFNGKENDNEPKGLGNQQDYGMRIYDPRIGRFLTIDPISVQYPELTPFQFASNTPIQAIDLDGLEAAGVGCGCAMSQLQSSQAADQTGKALIGVSQGIGISAKNSITGLWSTVTHPKQTVQNVWTAVSNPVKTWKGLKSDIKQWGQNLMSKDPNVAGRAVGSGYELVGEFVLPLPPIMKSLKIPYLSGRFIIGAKTLAKVTEHLESLGFLADEGNKIMISRMKKIANKEMKATEIDINFAKHELREAELMKSGKMTQEEAHYVVLKEQNMFHPDYEKKLYTQEAIEASRSKWKKEIDNK